MHFAHTIGAGGASCGKTSREVAAALVEVFLPALGEAVPHAAMEIANRPVVTTEISGRTLRRLTVYKVAPLLCAGRVT